MDFRIPGILDATITTVLNAVLDRKSDAFVVAAACSTTSSVAIVVVRGVDGGVQRKQLLVQRLLQRPRSVAAQRHRLPHLQRVQLVVQVPESVTNARMRINRAPCK